MALLVILFGRNTFAQVPSPYCSSNCSASNTIFVTSTFDDVPANPNNTTLREAIQSANSNVNFSCIQFNVLVNDGDGRANSCDPQGFCTIQINSPLTPVNANRPVEICGFSQAGAAPNTVESKITDVNGDEVINPNGLDGNLKIEIQGPNATNAYLMCVNPSASANPSTTCNGTTTNGANVVSIKGLVFNGSTAGTAQNPQQNAYLNIHADNVEVKGNYFGTEPDGLAANSPTPGSDIRIAVGRKNIIVGGPTPEDRNLISGTRLGIALGDGSNVLTTDVTIQGNFIHTDAEGSTNLNNVLNCRGPASSAGFESSPTNLYNCSILGVSLERIEIKDNVIANQIRFHSGSTPETTTKTLSINGNHLGIDAEGGNPLYQADNGATLVFHAVDNSSIVDNVIGGNATSGYGIILAQRTVFSPFLSVEESDGNLISENYIGTSRDQQRTISTFSTGVYFQDGKNNQVIGNTIANSKGAGGIYIDLISEAYGNRISQNSLFDNSSFGFQSGFGVRFSSHLQGANRLGSQLTLTGEIGDLPPGAPLTVEVFANEYCHPSGSGEGRQYLGSISFPATAGPGELVASICANPPNCTQENLQFIKTLALNEAPIGDIYSITAIYEGANAFIPPNNNYFQGDTSGFSQCASGTPCGNGTLDIGEQCDDGNNINGDCCNAQCQFDAPGSACGSNYDSDCDHPDTCDGTGSCNNHMEADNTACNDEDQCTLGDWCQGGYCTARTYQECGDNNPCTSDGCDPDTGCQFIAIPSCSGCSDDSECSDGNPCTDDACNTANGLCSHSNNNNSCNDLNECTENDQCNGGACGGTSVNCDDSDSCTIDSCNTGTGCTHGNNPACDCGNGSVEIGEQCDDGDLAGGDGCSSTCQVEAGFSCTGGTVCVPLCVSNSGYCDDGNPCTEDTCNPTLGCEHGFTPGGADCSGSNICLVNPTCDGGGNCVGPALDCDDQNTCTDDSCDPLHGGCQHADAVGTCDDDDVCTTGDTCVSGACQGTAVGQCFGQVEFDAILYSIDEKSPEAVGYYPNSVFPISDPIYLIRKGGNYGSVEVGFKTSPFPSAPDNETAISYEQSQLPPISDKHEFDYCDRPGADFLLNPNDPAADYLFTDVGCPSPGNETIVRFSNGDNAQKLVHFMVHADTTDEDNERYLIEIDPNSIKCFDDHDNPVQCPPNILGSRVQATRVILDNDTTAAADNDGIDNNGDGIVDEAGETTTVSGCACDMNPRTDWNPLTILLLLPALRFCFRKGNRFARNKVSGVAALIAGTAFFGIFLAAQGLSAQAADQDSDGIVDDRDNCPSVFNNTQLDYNGNGVGDACECVLPADSEKSCKLSLGLPPDLTQQASNFQCGTGPAACGVMVKMKSCADLGFSGNVILTPFGEGYPSTSACQNSLGLSGSTFGICSTRYLSSDMTLKFSQIICLGNISDAQCSLGGVGDKRTLFYNAPQVGGGTCDLDTGECVCPSICGSSCDDGNACTKDYCDQTGCQHRPLADGSSCGDGNACNGEETCAAGVCGTGTSLDCDDHNPCTDDSCDGIGGCTHTNNSASCDDGNACTDHDQCGGGSCQGGPGSNCDDNNACTTDSCDGASGCLHVAVSFNDANACTVDSCDPATGIHHSAINLDDGNACTEDSCNPSTGAIHTPINPDDSNACTNDSCNPSTGITHSAVNPNDGNACTVDACNPLTGVSNVPINCNDNNACTIDSCDSTLGCQTTPVTVDDGNICTSDICTPAGGVTHTPISCDDGNACTADSCNPGVGCVHGSAPPEDCNDLADNDCDGMSDCEDSDCISETTCTESQACSMDFTSFPNAICAQTTQVKTMAELAAWLNGPKNTNLKVLKHQGTGRYAFGGNDLTIVSNCSLEFNPQATFFDVEDVNLRASEILLRNDILSGHSGTMTLQAGRRIEVRPASKVDSSVLVESPNVLYRGDVTSASGSVALCGNIVEMMPASLMQADTVFMHARENIILRGDIIAADEVTLVSDKDLILRPANMIGSYDFPVGATHITVDGYFEDRGDIRSYGNVTITTGRFSLFGGHSFDVHGTCTLTGAKNPNSKGILGLCVPGY